MKNIDIFKSKSNENPVEPKTTLNLDFSSVHDSLKTINKTDMNVHETSSYSRTPVILVSPKNKITKKCDEYFTNFHVIFFLSFFRYRPEVDDALNYNEIRTKQNKILSQCQL